VVLFGSRGITVALYALSVMLVIGLGFLMFRIMFGRKVRLSDGISWGGTAAVVMLGEFLYSELEFWQHHNGMAGVWIYLGLPFFAGILWAVAVAIVGRKR